ncbi:MAG: hypothetical protein D6727_01535 [Gammaproteobacteria bacterium]|nr:MAG: hypothetical protein D6727_01535 [Gammaproteobacteria bacterium]
MGKPRVPRPPDILRKSGPHKDRSKYDRKRERASERRERARSEADAAHGVTDEEQDPEDRD